MVKTSISSPTYSTPILFTVSRLKSKTLESKHLLTLNDHDHDHIANKLRDNPESLKLASTDYGNITKQIPSAVLYPTSINDITNLIKSSNDMSVPFHIAARGRGHCVRGQAMTHNGIVINMENLNSHRNGPGITISRDDLSGFYGDVGGEMLWIDVLRAALDYGFSPVSWTDYLYITVGGTLSNAGIGGHSFRYGPQICNVKEMDVVTGKGDFVTCSAEKNSELFHGVLGGLGQFGIITRARIPLEPAPKRVKWVRMLYADFFEFSKDQERLISINGRNQKGALDFLEGVLLMHYGPPENWRSSFFPPSDHSRIISIVNQHSIIYCLEIAKFYDDHTQNTVENELELLFKGLNFIEGLKFEKDVTYEDFLNRVRSGELKLQSEGLWDVPHPWLNLFVPKSRILDFNSGVFKDILLRRRISRGPILIYPMNRSKWDDKMSAVIPNEDVFYTVGFLHSGGFDDWEAFDEQNNEVLDFCATTGIEIKQYLPHYTTLEDWIKHFGSKWTTFRERKEQFDPKMILSPGQRIFNV